MRRKEWESEETAQSSPVVRKNDGLFENDSRVFTGTAFTLHMAAYLAYTYFKADYLLMVLVFSPLPLPFVYVQQPSHLIAELWHRGAPLEFWYGGSAHGTMWWRMYLLEMPASRHQLARTRHASKVIVPPPITTV